MLDWWTPLIRAHLDRAVQVGSITLRSRFTRSGMPGTAAMNAGCEPDRDGDATRPRRVHCAHTVHKILSFYRR